MKNKLKKIISGFIVGTSLFAIAEAGELKIPKADIVRDLKAIEANDLGIYFIFDRNKKDNFEYDLVEFYLHTTDYVGRGISVGDKPSGYKWLENGKWHTDGDMGIRDYGNDSTDDSDLAKFKN